MSMFGYDAGMKQISLPEMGQNVPQQLVRKSNDLIEARYRLSVEEQKIILLLASQISSSDEDFNEYELHVAKFASQFGLELNGKLYTSMEQAAEGLLGRVISLKTETEDTVARTVWFSYIEYVKGKGRIKLRFDKSLKPYLLQLKQHFTQYPLQHVVNFRCQYSVRLYELLKMEAYKAKNGRFERTLAIQDYREMLGIGKKEYPVFADLRRRVIEPPVQEITSQTDLNILKVEYLKEGRRITRLTFYVELRSETELLEHQRQQVQQPKQKTQGLHRVIKRLVELGFALDTAKKFKNKYGVRRIERNIAYALAKKQESGVKNMPAYLNRAIADDLGGAWDRQRKQKARKDKKAEECEARSEQAHMEKLAAMSGVSLESLLGQKVDE